MGGDPYGAGGQAEDDQHHGQPIAAPKGHDGHGDESADQGAAQSVEALEEGFADIGAGDDDSGDAGPVIMVGLEPYGEQKAIRAARAALKASLAWSGERGNPATSLQRLCQVSENMKRWNMAT
jgi:hypothetical protein